MYHDVYVRSLAGQLYYNDGNGTKWNEMGHFWKNLSYGP